MSTSLAIAIITTLGALVVAYIKIFPSIKKRKKDRSDVKMQLVNNLDDIMIRLNNYRDEIIRLNEEKSITTIDLNNAIVLEMECKQKIQKLQEEIKSLKLELADHKERGRKCEEKKMELQNKIITLQNAKDELDK